MKKRKLEKKKKKHKSYRTKKTFKNGNMETKQIEKKT